MRSPTAAGNGRVHVLSSLVEGDTPSTKSAIAALEGLGARRNLLVVLDRGDLVSWKSLRNLDRVHVLSVDQLNTYDVLVADDVVFTTSSLESFLAGCAQGQERHGRRDRVRGRAEVEVASRSRPEVEVGREAGQEGRRQEGSGEEGRQEGRAAAEG